MRESTTNVFDMAKIVGDTFMNMNEVLKIWQKVSLINMLKVS